MTRSLVIVLYSVCFRIVCPDPFPITGLGLTGLCLDGVEVGVVIFFLVDEAKELAAGDPFKAGRCGSAFIFKNRNI